MTVGAHEHTESRGVSAEAFGTAPGSRSGSALVGRPRQLGGVDGGRPAAEELERFLGARAGFGGVGEQRQPGVCGGLAGSEYISAYAASKFGVDGWMESLAPEVEPFGIHTTVVNPGFFRTELLTKESTNYAPASIEDYAERNAAQREFWEGMNGQQGGDPAKLAQALLTITDEEQPPFRFIAGADALAQAEQKLAERQQQIDAYRDLSSSLALDEAETAA
jgi:NAD(P)-dependent dehydrogenase (short-subunit alcohol dehydrogenase family)